MRNKNRYLFYIAYFILTIPIVILIFKFIEPKKFASLFAGTLFITCSLLVAWGELRNKTIKSFSMGMAMIFLIFFSGPMILVRIINYDLDFSEIQIAWFTGQQLHHYSNYAFVALIAASAWDYLKARFGTGLLKDKT